MKRQSVWAGKVAGLVKAGNTTAAIAQIKVAPSVRDVQQLRDILHDSQLLQKYRAVDEATADQIAALSAPRLHRSP